MNSTYAQKSSTVQKAVAPNAASVLDSSAQNESLQRKADMANSAAQRAEAPRPNNTGMPDNLKSGIECLSGFSMDDVRVYYNSSKPATVQALAYTQGTDIHVAPGQEKCLPHEAWHVAQQMAGRVSPTTNINGMPVNDNAALEHEADVMGEKAVQCKMVGVNFANGKVQNTAVQRMAFANPKEDGTVSAETEQYEGKKLFGRNASDKRSPELAALVDLYKKEMLTRIAAQVQYCIENEHSDLEIGPHISVAITGGVWYIAVNTLKKILKDGRKDVKGVDQDTIDTIKTESSRVNLNVKKEFNIIVNDLKKRYLKDEEEKAEEGSEKNDKEIVENIDFEKKCKDDESKKETYLKQQALYIAYRWASRCADPVVTNCVHEFSAESKVDARSKHGEMQTIDYLNCLPSLNWEKKCLEPKDRMRVVRIGGTKTPCFDCADEIYRCGCHHESAKAEGKKRHDLIVNRRVVTMTDEFGDAFDNWYDGIWKRDEKNNVFLEGFECFQNQGYHNLMASFLNHTEDFPNSESIKNAVEFLNFYKKNVVEKNKAYWGIQLNVGILKAEYKCRKNRFDYAFSEYNTAEAELANAEADLILIGYDEDLLNACSLVFQKLKLMKINKEEKTKEEQDEMLKALKINKTPLFSATDELNIGLGFAKVNGMISSLVQKRKKYNEKLLKIEDAKKKIAAKKKVCDEEKINLENVKKRLEELVPNVNNKDLKNDLILLLRDESKRLLACLGFMYDKMKVDFTQIQKNFDEMCKKEGVVFFMEADVFQRMLEELLDKCVCSFDKHFFYEALKKA